MLIRSSGGSLILLLMALVTVPSLTADEVLAPRTAARLRNGQPVRIVCFGDSVTGVYYHTGSRRAYTDMLGLALRRLFPAGDVTTINGGISGHTTVNGLARIDKDVLAHEPTLVTVMFGLNDMTRVPLDQYAANLREIIARCARIDAEVLLCTPNNVITTAARPTSKLIQYCEVVRAVGRELKVPVVDCYRQLDELRERDALAWRLLMSDEIHPNMAGHKRIAELLATAIAGREVSLDDVPPPAPALVRTRQRLDRQEVVRVLAMPPYDECVSLAWQQLNGDAKVEVTSWNVAGKSMAEIEAEAKARVRAMQPDLVVIAVPRTAGAKSQEAFIHHFAWVMNWSLNFGPGGWDCLVVHASVSDSEGTDPARDALTRQLVRAQDLHLIDRSADDIRSAQELFSQWMRETRIP